MTRFVRLAIVFGLALPSLAGAQGPANFSGTWTLSVTDPPLTQGPAPAGGGGGGGGAVYDENAFGAVAKTVVITQTGDQLTLQSGAMTAVYRLDNTLTATPPDDIDALKTRAHWEGPSLHLHFKKGMNFGRDVLSLNGGTLNILRDLESGGGSTTRTITYAKAS